MSLLYLPLAGLNRVSSCLDGSDGGLREGSGTRRDFKFGITGGVTPLAVAQLEHPHAITPDLECYAAIYPQLPDPPPTPVQIPTPPPAYTPRSSLLPLKKLTLRATGMQLNWKEAVSATSLGRSAV